MRGDLPRSWRLLTVAVDDLERLAALRRQARLVEEDKDDVVVLAHCTAGDESAIGRKA